ncbi:hypothetical protein B0H14DRAFT_2590221 [Mycena olivaceomarginata]|nr:hypothetical protein B0H14DRAFT_2590221 [Mycena olivaceomarginata]
MPEQAAEGGGESLGVDAVVDRHGLPRVDRCRPTAFLESSTLVQRQPSIRAINLVESEDCIKVITRVGNVKTFCDLELLHEMLKDEKHRQSVNPSTISCKTCSLPPQGGLANFQNDKGKMKPGEARLYRILMAESAHLIWKIRCERLMQRNGMHPTETEVHNKWVLAMNNRLKLDCDMTDDRRFEKKAIPVKMVLRIWTGVLEGEDKLPTD